MQKIERNSYSELMAEVSKGNQEAFARLYDLFYPALVKHVSSKIGDESDAQDILHDLFLSLWNRREKIGEIQLLPAYLYSSCRYLIINYYKKLALSGKSEDVSGLELEMDEESIEDRLYYRYLLDLVNKEVDRLPEKCRVIFKMSRENYMSNKEIADYLGITESTVQNQIGKALQRIKKAAKLAQHLILYLNICC